MPKLPYFAPWLPNHRIVLVPGAAAGQLVGNQGVGCTIDLALVMGLGGFALASEADGFADWLGWNGCKGSSW